MKRYPACGTEYPDDPSFCSHDRTALLPFEGEGDTEQFRGLDPLVRRTIADRYRIVDLWNRLFQRHDSLQELEHAVSRALARWPQKRYATPAEFGRAVTEVAGGGGPTSGGVPDGRGRRHARRNAQPFASRPRWRGKSRGRDAVRDEGGETGAVVPVDGGGTRRHGEGTGPCGTPDLGSLNEAIMALQDSMFDVPEKRVSYRLRASRIFEQRTLPDSLRIRAALTVAAGHIADGELREAREWSVRTDDLIPESAEEMRSSRKAQIDQLAAVRN